MKLIPVMDLMDGLVVHARRGDRDNYRPIESTLCPSAAPEAILQTLIQRTRCDTIYIADLDAIRFRKPQLALLDQLKQRFRHLQFWLDAGVSDYQDFCALQQLDFGPLVIGSENVIDGEWLNPLPKHSWILSLDFKDGEFMGPESLLANANAWPHRVLAMNLSQVGSENGPDFELLKELKQRQAQSKIFAAGGVRDQNDLLALAQRGIAGALVATALHNGNIGGRPA